MDDVPVVMKEQDGVLSGRHTTAQRLLDTLGLRPQIRRQRHEDGVYRDVVHEAFGFDVELDGAILHAGTLARDADLDRDVLRLIGGADGVRLGWGQVVERPCLTATRLGRLLQQRGWTGTVKSAACCRQRRRSSAGG